MDPGIQQAPPGDGTRHRLGRHGLLARAARVARRWCKKIRDDRGYWSKIEAYLSARTDAQFTHGICPDCDAKLIADEAGSDAAS
jgi:hypothetical protein